MNLIQDKNKCSGCGACENVCKRNAISMKPDSYGFLYPSIDPSQCVKCGECVRVCDFRKDDSHFEDKYEYYGVVNKNHETLFNSSSGGAFSALAEWTLQQGGVVYGCALNSELMPEIVCVDKTEDLSILHGSKYVQANVNYSYRNVLNKLKEGCLVLFSGTPCQCAALRSYLKTPYDNLFCVELLCHGVPNSIMYADFLRQIEKRIHGKIETINFRNKKLGWGALLKVAYKTKKGKNKEAYYKPEEFSYYYNFFYRSLFFRESCYFCKYANRNRQSDFTIGDFWGGQSYCPSYNATEGISVLIAKGDKAISIVPSLRNYLNLKAVKLEDIASQNKQVLLPSSKDPEYEKEIEQYLNLGPDKYEELYNKLHRNLIIKGKVRRMMPLRLKRFVMRLISKS